MPAVSTQAKIPLRELIASGLLAFPLAFVGLPLYIYIPDLYATQHGVSVAALGIILLVVRLFDAFQDPVIGFIGDRYRRYRHAVMIVFFAVFAISFFLLYHPTGNAEWWLAIMLLLATTGYSVLSINLNAIGSLWSADPQEKTRIVAVREALGIAGLLTAVLLPPALQKLFPQSDRFALFAAIALALACACWFVFSRWYVTNKTVFARTLSSEKPSWRRMFSRRLSWFYVIYGLTSLSSAIPAALLIFFVRDYLNAENYLGACLLLYFGCGFAAVPLWQMVARKDKKRAWLGAMILAVASFTGAYFLQPGDITAYLVICALSGAAFGGELILPPSILSDLLDDGGADSETASSFAMMSFLTKAALALASGVSLSWLGQIGFVPAADNDEKALRTLLLCYAAVPCLIKIAAIIAAGFWTVYFNKETYNETQIHPRADRMYPHA